MPGYLDGYAVKDQDLIERCNRELDSGYEERSENLANLVKRVDEAHANDKVPEKIITEEIRKIGETFCFSGGDSIMRIVAYRVSALGGRVQTLELLWDGICGWKA